MPPQAIIIGMPPVIMAIMRLQYSMNMSFDMSSIGIISQTMPVAVILQVILHIIMGIGIMPPIIPIPWGIMFIMPFIGIMPWGIIPPIIGMFMGIMPLIGMFIIGICIWGFISGGSVSLEATRERAAVGREHYAAMVNRATTFAAATTLSSAPNGGTVRPGRNEGQFQRCRRFRTAHSCSKPVAR